MFPLGYQATAKRSDRGNRSSDYTSATQWFVTSFTCCTQYSEQCTPSIPLLPPPTLPPKPFYFWLVLVSGAGSQAPLAIRSMWDSVVTFMKSAVDFITDEPAAVNPSTTTPAPQRVSIMDACTYVTASIYIYIYIYMPHLLASLSSLDVPFTLCALPIGTSKIVIHVYIL